MEKYVNTKTGAIINSPSFVKGKNWEIFDESFKKTKKETEPVKEEVIEQTEPVKEENNEFNSLTVEQIKQELDALGIEYNSKAKKKELYDLMIQGA